MKRLVATIYLLSLVTHCWATPPLVDAIEYEGEESIVHPIGKPWLELLENEKTREIRRQERCSAIGAPRANWRISDGRLLLVSLFSCRGKIKLETIYGGVGDPILADWITSKIIIQRGKRLCERWGYYGGEPTVQETTVVFSVEQGLVTDFESPRVWWRL